MSHLRGEERRLPRKVVKECGMLCVSKDASTLR